MKTISWAKLKMVLEDAGVTVTQVHELDEQFDLPSPEWVSELARSTGNFLHASGIRYRPQRYDCENFALSAVARAGECNAITPADHDAGVAFGLFCYMKPIGINPGSYTGRGSDGVILSGHCINVAVHEGSNPDTYDVAFYEPQPMQGSLSIKEICMRRITLSKEEKASCFCALFA